MSARAFIDRRIDAARVALCWRGHGSVSSLPAEIRLRFWEAVKSIVGLFPGPAPDDWLDPQSRRALEHRNAQGPDGIADFCADYDAACLTCDDRGGRIQDTEGVWWPTPPGHVHHAVCPDCEAGDA